MMTHLVGCIVLAVLGFSEGSPMIRGEQPQAMLRELPMAFESNQGQFDSQVDFAAQGEGYRLFLKPSAAVLSIPGPGQDKRAVYIEFRGANENAQGEGMLELPGKANYFIGRDPSDWHLGVSRFEQVCRHDVYPGIDVIFYGNQGRLEYDMEVNPGATPENVEILFSGADTVAQGPDGQLTVKVGGIEVYQHVPVAYQVRNGERFPVTVQYVFRSANSVGFTLGDYDKGLPLVIDPVLTYSTHLGGSAQEEARGIDIDRGWFDESDPVFVVGQTDSMDFPGTEGAGPSSGKNVFVTALNPELSGPASVIFSGYYGGDKDDVANDVKSYMDSDQYVTLFITGETHSENFPVTGNALFQQINQGFNETNSDAFLARVDYKLDTSSLELTFSTFFGGDGDDWGNSILLSVSSLYLAGGTKSLNFPVLDGYFANPLMTQDGFVSHIGSIFGSPSVMFSTYLGGQNAVAKDIALLDSNMRIAVTGITGDGYPVNGFPVQSTFGGGTDAFVTVLDETGIPDPRQYSSYLGGEGRDGGLAIVRDPDLTTRIYVAGYTASTFIPGTDAVKVGQLNGTGLASTNTDGFLCSLGESGQIPVFFMYIGGADDETFYDVAIDGDSLWGAGETSSGGTWFTNYTPDYPPVQSALNQGDNIIASDALVVDVDTSTASPEVVFMTYLGGKGNDGAIAMRIDSYEHLPTISIAGVTASEDFWRVNPVQYGRRGVSDAFVAQLNSVVFVNVNSTGTPGGGTWNTAFHNIPDGLAATLAINTPKEVWVAGGQYFNVDLSLLPDVAVYGSFQPGAMVRSQRNIDVSPAVIDAQSLGTVVYGTSNCRFDSFEVKNGYAMYGAGMNNDAVTSLTVANCYFHDNVSFYAAGQLYAGSGGAAFQTGSTVTYVNCKFVRNTASYGGAIFIDQSTCYVSQCTFSYNLFDASPLDYGGKSISAGMDASAYVQNCIFWDGLAGEHLEHYQGFGNFFVGNSIVEGYDTPDATILTDQDPLFTQPPLPDNLGNVLPLPESPARSWGSMVTFNPIFGNATFDIGQIPRTVLPECTRLDVGAYDMALRPPVITLNDLDHIFWECGTAFVDPGAVALDDCRNDLSGAISVTGIVEITIPGDYTLSYNVSDALGNPADTVTRTVTVQDTTAPVISLNGADPDAVECGNVYADPGAVTLPDCDTAIVVNSNSINVVDIFTPGDYVVTYTAQDAAGNEAAAVMRTVQVQDTAPPVIALIGANPLTLECSSAYADPGATVTDICDASVTVNNNSAAVVDMSTPGDYTVTYSAQDDSGNSAAPVTRTVSVQDTTPPVITLVGANPLTLECGSVYGDPGAIAADACDLSITVNNNGATMVDMSASGDYTVTYSAQDDSGNSAAPVTRTVQVQDTLNPVVTLTGNASITLDCGATYTEQGATALDTCDGDLSTQLEVSILRGTETVGSIDTSAAAVYLLTYWVEDTAGRLGQAQRTVTIEGPGCAVTEGEGAGEGEGEGAGEGEGEGAGEGEGEGAGEGEGEGAGEGEGEGEGEEDTVSVTTLLDTLDGTTTTISALINNPGTDGRISLREAMIAANNTAGSNTINFTVNGTITPGSQLPSINDATGGTDINGGGNITISGRLLSINKAKAGESGFVVESASNILEGLTIVEFPLYGVLIKGSEAHDNIVRNCSIGTDGTNALANVSYGICIIDGAYNNVIGGLVSNTRNIISSNGDDGIYLSGAGVSGNRIYGNYIGLGNTGSNDLGNRLNGVMISGGASANYVGGNTSGTRNYISGNKQGGVVITGSGSDGNFIQGNYIGINAAATIAVPNAFQGVMIYEGASGNLIGGTVGGSTNTISQNVGDGVLIMDAGSLRNTVRRNSIHHNGGEGVRLMYGANNSLSAGAINRLRPIISGTAPANTIIEFFADREDEGQVYLATTLSSAGGTFGASVDLTAYAGYNLVIACTDTTGNTSGFSEPFVIDL
ncbi:MAG TPA: DUF5011 domain-containing protein, partial [Candidatus Hydrogenedentes bacterium]|nr:DUF5011 domain-containing protein [Candidatus Hydrogenedentota bacterium]